MRESKCKTEYNFEEIKKEFEELMKVSRIDKKWIFKEYEQRLRNTARIYMNLLCEKILNENEAYKKLKKELEEIEKKIDELYKKEKELQSKMSKIECEIYNNVKEEIMGKVEDKLKELLGFLIR